MTLIKSISGIRGTLGDQVGEGLTPLDIVKFVSAYGEWLKKSSEKSRCKVVVGRDARVSGQMVNSLVAGTLLGVGIDVIDCDLATTPTVEMAVVFCGADGGIILTASHNPGNWNALKLLNGKGEFISAEDGAFILDVAEKEAFNYAPVENIGKYTKDESFTDRHIEAILKLPWVDVNAIEKADFTVALDCVNSVGGIAIPQLLKALKVKNIIPLYCEPNGLFPHNPEPLPENLSEISAVVKDKKADVGFVVDPDVDRLALISEDGSMFGEEYTLVAIADYMLSQKKGNTVSNLSSSRALRDVTQNYGGNYCASAVGEVNVVNKMKETNALIGGEGNGGIILPELHYGRDALVGIAMFLTYLAKTGKKVSEIRAGFPQYVISKNKIQLTPTTDVDAILAKIKELYSNQEVNDIDGVKIDFENEWVHLRKSNTEPIIRIYSESQTVEKAEALAKSVMAEIEKLA